jgi:hypothetical protein
VAADVRRTVVRERDLLVAELRFHNLELDPTARRLVPSGAGEPLVILSLPPQHVAESLVPLHLETAAIVGTASRSVVGSRIAGWSRIVFRVPPGVASVPLELGPLLEQLGSWALQVPDAALPRSDDPSRPGFLLGLLVAILPFLGESGPGLRAPTREETALELPFRLILSPHAAAGFVHSSLPVLSGADRVELWHSQLGLAPGQLGAPEAPDRTVRGVWLRTGDTATGFLSDPTPLPSTAEEPFATTLNPQDRHQIVHLSANFRARAAGVYPRAIPVRRLAVTSLGATVNLRGEWAPPEHMDLEEWAHRAATGRDYFVRVVYAGWLFPFGHRASLVTIHERRFEAGPAHPALLHSRQFVVVREPVRAFDPSAAPTPQLGRTMPLRAVTVRTLITPDIVLSNAGAFAIELASGTGPVLFHLAGVDSANHAVEFHMPLWFVRQSAADADVLAAVNGFGESTAALAGGVAPPSDAGVPFDIVALDPADKDGGDSTWNARSIKWRGEPSAPLGSTPPQAPFHPRAASIGLRLPPVDVLTAAGAKPSEVSYHARFVEHGLDQGQNPGAVVAKLVTANDMRFARGDLAGGLVRPDLSISGLSHRLGPVAGAKLDDIASNAFNPSDFFAGAVPKLFGSLELDRLLKATHLLDGAVPRAPKLPPLPERVELTWEPQLRDYPDPPHATFVTQPNSKLTLHVRAQDSGPSEIDCRLEKFAIRLVQPDFACIELHFELAAFKVASAKPDIDVRLEDIKFIGALSFVETLRKIIPLEGFSDPPAINVTPSGADASLSLSVPSLPLGMFSLENISFGAGFLVPFDDRALAVRFNFCQRQEPFLLTVSALGGGGYVLIELDARAFQRLEAALEFGASLSMDFVVASGSVHAMAGIYFAYDSKKGVTLTGYLRIGGNVTALGIVSVSIELYLALTYQDPGKAKGIATLTVEVELFMFSTSVEISCERTFAGSSADPSFEEVMRPYQLGEEGVGDPAQGLQVHAGDEPWEQYWAAYA